MRISGPAFPIAVCFVLSLLLAGSTTFDTSNTDRVLSTPSEIEDIAARTFESFWKGTQYCDSAMMYSTMADAHSCSWSNWAMNDMSSEPRQAWNNDPDYARSASTLVPWSNHYEAITDGILVKRALDRMPASAFVEDDVDPKRIEAFVEFTTGLSYAHLAATFDRAFVLDPDVDLRAIALKSSVV